jgi:hypothetical protein
MATTVIPPRTRTHPPRSTRLRTTLAVRVRQATAMVGAARRHDWSPALTISGLACVDIAAWTTFGRGAAWLALGVSFFLFDFSREKPPR